MRFSPSRSVTPSFGAPLALALLLAAPLTNAAAPKAEKSDKHAAPPHAEKSRQAEPEAPPLVWGYGNRTCAEYLLVYPDPKQPARPEIVAEFQHMREWVGGFATGLSLATGMDMLQGANVEEVMERMRTQCATQPSGDLFNATLGVFRALSTEKLDPKPKP